MMRPTITATNHTDDEKDLVEITIQASDVDSTTLTYSSVSAQLTSWNTDQDLMDCNS